MSSWLKSFEAVLEKVDSTAKELKSSASQKSDGNQDDFYSFDGAPIIPTSSTGTSSQSHNHSNRNSLTYAQPPTIPRVQVPVITNSRPTLDDKDIFEFLNAPLEEAKRERKAATPRENENESDENVENDTTAKENTNHTEDSVDDKLSDLQLENKLLRSEIVSLNQELVSVTNRAKVMQQEFEKVAVTLQDAQRSLFEKEKLIAKLKRNEEEFDIALSAKNSQIATLQTKLEEAHQDMKSRDEKLQSFQSDKESTAEAHNQSRQLIREKLEQLEKSLKDEIESHSSTKQQWKNRERELESNISDMTRALATTQRSYEDKTSELMKMQMQLKELQDINRTMKQELTDYKLRATKVLQEKEKTIKELTIQLSGDPETTKRSEVSLADHIQLQQECNSLKDERDELKNQIDQIRNNLSDIQSQMESEIEVLQTNQKELEESLQKEQKRVQTLQIDLLMKGQENAAMKDEMDKKIDTLQTTLKYREDEILKVKRQLQVKSLSSSSQEELESRLQAITEHLIQKQNQLETLSSEKAYLQLQVENLLQAQSKSSSSSDHTVVIDLNEDGTTTSRAKKKGKRLRPISSLVENTSYVARNQILARRVVGAANFLDSISTVTGSYLRSSPVARLLVMLYMFILHFWVFYLFFTWNPEIHENEAPFGVANIPS